MLFSNFIKINIEFKLNIYSTEYSNIIINFILFENFKIK